HTVSAIRERFPDCAITLSVGERSRESYRSLKEAGADRFLLRHETADCGHYGKLHPDEMSFENRMGCLRSLKELGYQTGCGFMVGSPYQTRSNLIEDLRFIWEFKPAMVGIGPFIPAKGTPFEREAKGSAELTLRLLSVIRLMRPDLLLPATTALGTAAEDGRTRGILAGANVIMPNLSPENARKNYSLYDNKLNTGCEAAENLAQLKASMMEIGYEIVTDRGDSPAYING
ncbi:MAG TPA: [FeFe] hydrogenase H-cluster radical SAM maturase HydE, partial [Candidatus Avanaerovorax faecigallinarum]|nr:[FeFe] hydrogenase H-cluster radical SAM maturase HydE [Candidatus Avanaerovorax faecigallinarum]